MCPIMPAHPGTQVMNLAGSQNAHPLLIVFIIFNDFEFFITCDLKLSILIYAFLS
jgi:hypothetical protein